MLATAPELAILKDVGPAAEIGPIVAVGVLGLLLIGKFVIIPLANIVFGHQRQLAGVGNPASEADRKKIEHLEAEVQELKDRLNEQAILLDDRRSVMAKQEEFENRLKS